MYEVIESRVQDFTDASCRGCGSCGTGIVKLQQKDYSETEVELRLNDGTSMTKTELFAKYYSLLMAVKSNVSKYYHRCSTYHISNARNNGNFFFL